MNIKNATHIGFLNKNNNLVIWNEIKKESLQHQFKHTCPKQSLTLIISDFTIINKNSVEPLEISFIIIDSEIYYFYLLDFQKIYLDLEFGPQIEIDVGNLSQKAFPLRNTTLLHNVNFLYGPNILNVEEQLLIEWDKERFYHNNNYYQFSNDLENCFNINIYYGYNERNKVKYGIISYIQEQKKINFNTII